MARPRGLILDYGNVLTWPQDQAWMDAAAPRMGASPAAFRAAYWRHRHDYDADLPASEYWRRVIVAARPTGDGTVAETDLRWLIGRDVESWCRYRHEAWALAASFRTAGGLTALLSNSGPEVMARVRADHPLEARFDAVVISCEVGLAKPDPRVFQLCLERLGLSAGEALFVDDRVDNVEGAARVGLATLHFEGPDALERLRTRLG